MSLRKIKRGITAASRIIGLTAGARGRLIVIDTGIDPLATKDGVSVARYFTSDDEGIMSGIKLVRQACSAQLREHGDGTTATAVMLGSLVWQHMSSHAVRAIDKELARLKPEDITPAGDLFDAALTSANYNNDIAKPIFDAVKRNGKDGLFLCEQAPVQGIVAESVNGFYLQGGYADPYCVNTNNGTAVFVSPLVYCKAEYNLTDIMPAVNQAMGEGRALILIGQPDEQARESLKENHLKGILTSAIVVPEKIGRQLDVLLTDVQKILNGQTGTVARAVVSRHSTILTHSVDLSEYAESVRASEASSDAEKSENEMRASRLLGKVCMIKVGAQTASALRQFSDQVDDCLKSTLSAAKHGTCAGGGLGLLNTVKNPHLRRAVKAYMRAIGDKTGTKKLNAYGAVFIDSRGVVVSAIKNAWAVARQIHTAGDAIIYKKALPNQA